jgi:hypothetical protein
MTNRQEKLLERWHTTLLAFNGGHFVAAARCEHRNLYLGVPTTLLATVTGTSIFATLTISPQVWAKILVGLLSLTAAVLASQQTFLRYGERAQVHKNAGQKFGALRREIEETYVCHSNTDEALPQEFFTSIRTRWDQVSEESPPLPQKIHDQAKKGAAGVLAQLSKRSGENLQGDGSARGS